jgi:copper(I)-binding protein
MTGGMHVMFYHMKTILMKVGHLLPKTINIRNAQVRLKTPEDEPPVF